MYGMGILFDMNYKDWLIVGRPIYNEFFGLSDYQ